LSADGGLSPQRLTQLTEDFYFAKGNKIGDLKGRLLQPTAVNADVHVLL
jgi:hypothetical protein